MIISRHQTVGNAKTAFARQQNSVSTEPFDSKQPFAYGNSRQFSDLDVFRPIYRLVFIKGVQGGTVSIIFFSFLTIENVVKLLFDV